MLKCYDWECKACGYVIMDSLDPAEQQRKKCPECGKWAKKIISSHGALNETPAWMHETLKVIDPDDTSHIAQELKKNASRTALRRYMKEKGIRFLEDGEKTMTNKDREEMRRPRMESLTKKLVERHMERNRIKVRG